MNQNLSAAEAAFVAEFKSSHFAIMAELRQKVLDTLANPDAKMSEYNAALLMELRIERYIYQLSQRQERAERAQERHANSVRPRATETTPALKPSVEPAAPPANPPDPEPAARAAEPPRAPDPKSIPAPTATSPLIDPVAKPCQSTNNCLNPGPAKLPQARQH